VVGGQARAPRANAPERLILDSGAVFALAQFNAEALRFVAEVRGEGGEVLIPVVVVAETSRGRGPRDARVNHVLKTADRIPPTTAETGRLAGRLLGKSGSKATIDALVVAEAVLAGPARILTSDPDDLRVLADDHPDVLIEPL
jgi:predicted nucleic acid-binding protein